MMRMIVYKDQDWVMAPILTVNLFISMPKRLAAAGHLNIVTSCREALTNISSRNLSTVRVFLSIQPPYILPFWGQFHRLIEKMFSISLPSKAPHSPSLHSGKVTWTLSFPVDFSFFLPLINHLLPIISKKSVWECQIFEIWMINKAL